MAIADVQCWAVGPDGQRCVKDSVRGSFFCVIHNQSRSIGLEEIWLAPTTEMPRKLVAALRREFPGVVFPEAVSAPAATEGATAMPPEAPAEGTTGQVMDASSPSSAQSQRRAADSHEPAGGDARRADPESGAHSLTWLLHTLQRAMEEVMAGDAAPLQKANVVARLGNLYLKGYQTAELQKQNAALRRRVEELEQRLADLDGAGRAQDGRSRVRDTPIDGPAIAPDSPALTPHFQAKRCTADAPGRVAGQKVGGHSYIPGAEAHESVAPGNGATAAGTRRGPP